MNMKWENKGMKTPLARAKGLGSAHEGADHWFQQRMTAIANIPLVLWFVYSIVQLKGASHYTFVNWLSDPINAILLILLILSVFFHAKLGTQVVTEDYVHHEGIKIVTLIAQKLIFSGLAIACVFSILKIAL